MTLVAPSAPILTIAHDWASPVERETAYPSTAMRHEDGSEQALVLASTPTTTLRYRLLAPSWDQAVQLKTLLESLTDALVRIPRWEDQTRLTAAASGDTIAADFADRPTFVVGAQVIVWRAPDEYEVGELATVADDTITLVDPLASTWAQGTVVAPISDGRLSLPLRLTHWVPTSGALDVEVTCGLRDLAGLGAGGTAVAGVPAAIDLVGTSVPHYGRRFVVATVTDAAGNVLSGADIVWSSSDPTNCPVWASGEPGVAIVSNPNALSSTFRVVTATLGAVSDTAGVGLG